MLPSTSRPTHITNVSDPSPGLLGKDFCCSRCPKRFSRSENLRRHLATHDSVGKYRCVVCDKHFTRSDLLKRHRKNHDRSSPAQSLNHLETQALPETYDTGRVPPLFAGSGAIGSENHAGSQQQDPVDMSFDDTFMTNEDISGLNLGAFDGDIAWTLDFAYSHPFMDSFAADLLTPSSTGNIEVDDWESPNVAHDEAGEWPDRMSRPASPKRRKSEKTHQTPRNWHATIAEAQLEMANRRIIDVALSSIEQETRAGLLEFLSMPTSPYYENRDLETFPPSDVLDYFLLLYFRHIHERFPVIHLATLQLSKISPFLLMALLLTGSSHSKANDGCFTRVFYDHFRVALMRKIEGDSRFLRSVDSIFALLLVCLAGTWSGGREAYEFAEGFRGVLVTTSRRCRLLDGRPITLENEAHEGHSSLDQIWYSWIESEKRKRLGLAIYLYDCQYPGLFNNQPYISKAETANSIFPCSRLYWEAKTSVAWKMLIGPANMPPSTFYIHALNTCLLPPGVIAVHSLDEFGKIVLLYAMHTHIFEWRQAISMLNPNGSANAYESFSFNIGPGLEERKLWLLANLKNWHTYYYSPSVEPAAAILYHLGFVTLEVSLSDLHLAAGRTGNRSEGAVAERSLLHWANGESAGSTMSHVHEGFDVTHAALQSGAMHSSFEIIMSLFTGGLVCWAYSKFHRAGPHADCVDHVRKAAKTLRELASWRISSLFGVILNEFENA
ncbi:hypothetical protein BKA61DRAFT_686305 [Leptodontidium sp. MPI-SDFR-AT-0119]|nr:hypothetical protein BKA61DRAFT_686305 [Leptodontidium sp. MPI-SDFR-AT-0119]